jgi:hypothetical protein
MPLNFVLLNSPSDPKPLIMQREHDCLAFNFILTQTAEMLPCNPRASEIIWNFTRYEDERRVTLRQNPHLYVGLPTSADAYGAGFSMNPTKDFNVKPNDTIYVLVDRSGLGCVHLEAEERDRAFGNVWMPKEAMIFKGTLEAYIST